ncbi:MAG TPA: BlaI/MecI/CopY family transcriptional regulator [Candidatus Brocadiia bacterium]|nr:BlaI/MecI/CopY family transcriptional regulator [Planctomycetota bacterium]MBI4007194.1 BlaI/MecI/CopY family transcriptional regulator [Planctomycetota bacterium]MDO8093841.1 BlaI/MecI/CopY family transcriptional regulator [Candidatus Brocadiales bacterium]
MIKSLRFSFNPFKEGLNQVLGDLEKRIMEILWEKGESTIREILDSLPHGLAPSYSTVITVTNRLAKKGLLERKKVKKTFFYRPLYGKDEFYGLVSRKVVEGVSSLSPYTTMVNLVDIVAKANPDRMEQLARLIEEKKLQKGSN